MAKFRQVLFRRRLEHGPPLDEAVKQAQKFLRRQGKEEEARLLCKVMVGSAWMGCRGELNKMCKRCGK